jgi:Glyoxalase-like domain
LASVVITLSMFAEAEIAADVPENLDHIIVGCSDLEAGVSYLEKLSGYRAAYGGSHPGRGTCNALLKLGLDSYLEILAPDPQQRVLQWHHEIAQLSEPLLVGWAVKHSDLDAYARSLRKRGIAVTGPTLGSRTRLNGETLRWTLLIRCNDREGILPFYIDWHPSSKHPSADAPGGCVLANFGQTGTLIETPPPAPHLQIRQYPDKPVQIRATIVGQFGQFMLASKSIPSEAWVSSDHPIP